MILLKSALESPGVARKPVFPASRVGSGRPRHRLKTPGCASEPPLLPNPTTTLVTTHVPHTLQACTRVGCFATLRAAVTRQRRLAFMFITFGVFETQVHNRRPGGGDHQGRDFFYGDPRTGFFSAGTPGRGAGTPGDHSTRAQLCLQRTGWLRGTVDPLLTNFLI